MTAPTSVYAVIVAGGSGLRMGAPLPKQFLDLCGRPVLYHSIKAFVDAMPDIHVILVAPERNMPLVQKVLEAFDQPFDIKIVAGGDTRYASVAAGLKEVPPDSIVLVHDGARPLLNPELILRCYKSASLNGSAVPVIPVADSIRQVSSFSSRAIARENLRSVQTPQAFASNILQEAFLQPYIPAFTDEASVVEWMGGTIHLVEGERSNIKITTPEDLVIAAALLLEREKG
jgi:2-C-methyl-D-erythritol 4-phosphate cytidylyltransferase